MINSQIHNNPIQINLRFSNNKNIIEYITAKVVPQLKASVYSSIFNFKIKQVRGTMLAHTTVANIHVNRKSRQFHSATCSRT